MLQPPFSFCTATKLPYPPITGPGEQDASCTGDTGRDPWVGWEDVRDRLGRHFRYLLPNLALGWCRNQIWNRSRILLTLLERMGGLLGPEMVQKNLKVLEIFRIWANSQKFTERSKLPKDVICGADSFWMTYEVLHTKQILRILSLLALRARRLFLMTFLVWGEGGGGGQRSVEGVDWDDIFYGKVGI